MNEFIPNSIVNTTIFSQQTSRLAMNSGIDIAFFFLDTPSYVIFSVIFIAINSSSCFHFLITCYPIISSEGINLTPTRPVFVRAWGLYKISDDFLLLRNLLQFLLCNNQQPKCFSESIKHDLKVESHYLF